MTKSTHGGQRKGAGPPRKMVEPERTTITLDRRVKKTLAERYGRKWQDVIRDLIDKHLEETR